METENNTNVVLLCINDFLVVSLCEDCKEESLNTERGLNNVRNVSLVCFGIEIIKALA